MDMEWLTLPMVTAIICIYFAFKHWLNCKYNRKDDE
jgi:hypothetical protein